MSGRIFRLGIKILQQEKRRPWAAFSFAFCVSPGRAFVGI
jgi:hypothetical protein